MTGLEISTQDRYGDVAMALLSEPAVSGERTEQSLVRVGNRFPAVPLLNTPHSRFSVRFALLLGHREHPIHLLRQCFLSERNGGIPGDLAVLGIIKVQRQCASTHGF